MTEQPDTQGTNAPTAEEAASHYIGILQHTFEWHAQQVAELEKINEHPDAKIRLGNEDDPNAIVLEGDQAKSFRVGIRVALHYLGKLPYDVSQADDDEDT